MYIASATNASFMLIGMPILARNLAQPDWNLVAYGVSSISIYTSFDFAANSILGVGKKDNFRTNFMEVYAQYIFIGIVVCIAVSIFLWYRLSIPSNAKNIVSSSTGLFLIFSLGIIFYFSQLQAIALNGLRLNKIVSINAIIGSTLRWMGPILSVTGDFTTGSEILLLCVMSYMTEYILSGIYFRRYKKDLHPVSYQKVVFSRNWIIFFQNSILLSIAGLVSQIDKIMLVGNVSSEEYARYILMITFCQIPLMLQYPLQRYLLPRYSSIRANPLFFAFVAIILLINCLISILLPQFFGRWSGLNLSDQDFIVLRYLSIGFFMHCLFSYSQCVLLIFRCYVYIFKTNIFAIGIGLLVLVFTSGIMAGAYAWLCIGSIQFVFSSFYLWKLRHPK